MSVFEDREKAFEAQFIHQADERFRITARRNHLLGLWVAEKLGKTTDEAEAYALEIVRAEVSPRADEAVYDRISGDLAAAGVPQTEQAIRAQMVHLMAVAAEQL